VNLLLVTVDSLRADHVGYSGYRRDVTPFLDSLAAESAFFERAYSASVHTRESIPSILTGRYPPEAVTKTYAMQGPTLPERLGRVGYHTGAVLSSPFLTTDNGYDRGFDLFDSNYPPRTPGMLAQYVGEFLGNSHYRDGYDVNDSLLEFVAGADDPFFAWAHYMDIHGPYNRFDDVVWGEPVGERRLQMLYRRAKYLPATVTDAERRTLVDQYDNAVRHFDGVVADLFERLGAAGVLEDTVVFITSDHGESFGENGAYEHGRNLYPELLHVPLLVHGGGRSDDVGRPVSTVDVHRSLADRAGLETGCDGEPLFRDSRESAIRASCLNFFRREEVTLAGN
jgi:arylsulfatase